MTWKAEVGRLGPAVIENCGSQEGAGQARVRSKGFPGVDAEKGERRGRLGP